MLPAWVRAVLAFDRAVAAAHEIEATLRDELLWAWVRRDRREALTSALYARDRSYAPGGGAFERGSFAWEERVLAHPSVPRAGRVLLGGAGGGRELRALVARGFEVTAFEPCEALARDAEGVAAGVRGARVLRGRYADLEAAARGDGPLASIARDAPYALVVLGWRSLSHVVEEGDRVALFRALSQLAPRAPVIASFLPAGRPHPQLRAQRAFRLAFRALGAPSSAPPGAAFIPIAGFAVASSRADIASLARRAGYDLAVCETEHEGIALFTRP